VETKVVALQGRCHLNASVAGDAVEVVLIALIAAPQGAVEPEAGLDCAAGNEVVTLPCQGLSGCGWVHAVRWKVYPEVYSYSSGFISMNKKDYIAFPPYPRSKQ
jgi:hypothetical protein